jgi:integrase
MVGIRICLVLAPRSITRSFCEVIYPGLLRVRFHDARHTAVTTLAEKGLPDWVIQAQVGHVAPQMMKTYSHVRRLALDQAAAALEPTSLSPKREAELVN